MHVSPTQREKEEKGMEETILESFNKWDREKSNGGVKCHVLSIKISAHM